MTNTNTNTNPTATKSTGKRVAALTERAGPPWGQVEAGRYGDYAPAPPKVSRIPAGWYQAAVTMRGGYLRAMGIESDKQFDLPSHVLDDIVREFGLFWRNVHLFKERGLVAKRGILLHGQPGGGKTTAIRRLADRIIKDFDGAVLFEGSFHMAEAALSILRNHEPDRPCLLVMEDIDQMLKEDDEEGLLDLLDGTGNMNGVFVVATTNYIEDLPDRIVNRPGRFDRVLEIEGPTLEARRQYFQVMAGGLPGVTPERIERWAEASKGLTMAHLREAIVGLTIFEEDEDAVFSRLRGMKVAR